jgi:hypothetical protein
LCGKFPKEDSKKIKIVVVEFLIILQEYFQAQYKYIKIISTMTSSSNYIPIMYKKHQNNDLSSISSSFDSIQSEEFELESKTIAMFRLIHSSSSSKCYTCASSAIKKQQFNKKNPLLCREYLLDNKIKGHNSNNHFLSTKECFCQEVRTVLFAAAKDDSDYTSDEAEEEDETQFDEKFSSDNNSDDGHDSDVEDFFEMEVE